MNTSRYPLEQYVKERISLLRTVESLLQPDGVVVFQEPDTLLSELIVSHNQAPPLFGRCLTWMRKLFEQTGNDAHSVARKLTL